ncbi:hypothetical protein D3C87_129710 [compost metagenome]
MFKQFKSLVENARNNHVKNTREASEMKFGYIFNNEQSFELFLYQRIKELLEIPYKERPIQKSKFFKIQEDLINRFILANENYNPYFEIINTIKYSCNTERTGLCHLENIVPWLQAIEIALIIYDLNTNSPMDEQAMADYYREYFDRAHSIQYLKDQGCPIELTDEDINITADKIFHEIEKDVKLIGGYTLAYHIFKNLSEGDKYSKLFDRYYIVREANLRGFGKPQIPYGYLLNLCAKYPHSENSVHINQIKNLFNKATLACNATYPVQHYNIWRYLLYAHEDTFELMTELALWDTIYSIPQARAVFQIEFVEYLISKFDHIDFEELFGFTAEEFIKVCSSIFLTEQTGPDRFTAQTIAQRTNLKFSTATAILKILSHDKRANKNYLVPSDSLNLDYQFKPLILLKDKYILLWRSWNALSLYEVIAANYRKIDKSIDQKIGYLIESFLQLKMTKNGIGNNCGKYYVGKIEGEADIVIETERKIILFEVKKKPLTRKSKSGSDVSLIIDLSESVVDASIQSSRTELLLRKEGQLVLHKEDGSKYLLEWKNKEFEHVSLSHMDYGGMQNNSVIQNMRVALLIYNWFVIDENDTLSVQKFKELQNKQADLSKQYQELMEHEAMPEHNPYFDNWFLNFNHLLELISLSDGNEKFYEFLIKSKFSSSGSLDFYWEFENALKLAGSEKNEQFRKISEQNKSIVISLRPEFDL